MPLCLRKGLTASLNLAWVQKVAQFLLLAVDRAACVLFLVPYRNYTEQHSSSSVGYTLNWILNECFYVVLDIGQVFLCCIGYWTNVSELYLILDRYFFVV
jgi:hypothetical protein